MSSIEGSTTRADLTEAEVQGALDDTQRVVHELTKVYQGDGRVVTLLLVGLLARGHILLEGVPGVAKTTLAKAFSETIDASFRRIQFTPDLLPGDITGTYVLNPSNQTFVLREGPVFAHIVLGDEINRAPAKTQSALLEAMQESQVTIEGETRALPQPFMVLATQNPVEQEGVYLLPEAQLDRFLIKVTMHYPSVDQEIAMLSVHATERPKVEAVLTLSRVKSLSQLADRVAVSGTIHAYIVALARATRKHPAATLGASPRASLALVRACRARALMRGRHFVNVEDVRDLAPAVFAHRVVPTPAALINGTDEHTILRAVLKEVAYDPA